MKLLNRPLFLSDLAWKSGLLIAGRGSSMGLSFLTSMLAARAMGGDEYGRYIFVMALVNWIGFAFTFGLDSVPKMLASIQEKEHQQNLLGGFFVFTGGMSLLFTLTLWICGLLIDPIFDTSVGKILMWIAPLAGANLFQIMIEWACYGLRKPGILSALLFSSRLINLIAILILIQMRITSAGLYYLMFLFSSWIFPLIGWIALRPNFSNLKQNLYDIKTDLGIFGKDAYIGRVPAALAYNLDRLLLGYFAPNRQVGFYGLAYSLTNPIIFVGGAVSQVAYRDFSSAKDINRKTILATLMVSVLACAGTFGLGVICVLFFLPPEFHDMLPLLFILSLSALFQSLYAPFNSFIGAKGKGEMLRNLGWTYTLSSIVLFSISIPLWGVIGASCAAVFINLIWLLQCVKMYYKIKQNIDRE